MKVGSLPFQNRREELREPRRGVVHDRQTGELQQLKNFGNFWRKPNGNNHETSYYVIHNSNLYAAVTNLSETGLVLYCNPILMCIVAVMSKFAKS